MFGDLDRPLNGLCGFVSIRNVSTETGYEYGLGQSVKRIHSVACIDLDACCTSCAS